MDGEQVDLEVAGREDNCETLNEFLVECRVEINRSVCVKFLKTKAVSSSKHLNNIDCNKDKCSTK